MQLNSPDQERVRANALLSFLPAEYKLAVALVFAIAVSVLQTSLAAGCACLLALCLLLLSGLNYRFIAKRLVLINFFFLFLWLLLPVSLQAATTEEPLFALGPFVFLRSGIGLALLITLKGNAITGALLALSGSASLAENAHALKTLRVPEKLVALLLIACTNISLLIEEYQRVFQAALLRGFTPQTSIKAYKTYANLIANLLVRAWQRSQRIEQAMRLRSFCGKFPLITPRLHPQKRMLSWFFCLFCVLYIVFIIYIDAM